MDNDNVEVISCFHGVHTNCFPTERNNYPEEVLEADSFNLTDFPMAPNILIRVSPQIGTVVCRAKLLSFNHGLTEAIRFDLIRVRRTIDRLKCSLGDDPARLRFSRPTETFEGVISHSKSSDIALSRRRSLRILPYPRPSRPWFSLFCPSRIPSGESLYLSRPSFFVLISLRLSLSLSLNKRMIPLPLPLPLLLSAKLKSPENSEIILC